MSSSSVYGLNKKIPFSELHAIDHPANLYGTSKFGNEQIARPTTTSTASSPWDSASSPCMDRGAGRTWPCPCLRTRSRTARPLRCSNGGEMWRDFTFVDDIVQGIELSMEYCSDNAASSTWATPSR